MRMQRLPESSLSERVNRLARNLDELKTTQFAGSTNVITERVVSANTYDFAMMVTYQTTTAWELTIPVRDATFSPNPFVWHVFWSVANSPINPGSWITMFDAVLPANGVAKYRIYMWGADSVNTPKEVDMKVGVYGINIGTFSVAQII